MIDALFTEMLASVDIRSFDSVFLRKYWSQTGPSNDISTLTSQRIERVIRQRLAAEFSAPNKQREGSDACSSQLASLIHQCSTDRWTHHQLRQPTYCRRERTADIAHRTGDEALTFEMEPTLGR
jgi:hypothetical protein